MSKPDYQVGRRHLEQRRGRASKLISGNQNVNWALTGVAGVLTLGRFATRGLISRQLRGDDAVHLCAFLVLIAHGATNQLTSAAKAQLAVDEEASSDTTPDALLAEYHHVYQLNTANNVLLYLVFWIVRVAFLVLYRLLFGASARFMKVWWVVFVFTIVTYFIPFGGVVATCWNETTIAGYKQCNSSDTSRAIKLEYSCAFNVATDISIMALPLWMIRPLNMKLQQKIALAFVFSIAIFCVALDILRVVEALASNQALYTVLEANMVVIISCLPSYGTLLSSRSTKERRRDFTNSRPARGSSSPYPRRAGSRTLDQAPVPDNVQLLRVERRDRKLSSTSAAVGRKPFASSTIWSETYVDTTDRDSHNLEPVEALPAVLRPSLQRGTSPEKAAHYSPK